MDSELRGPAFRYRCCRPPHHQIGCGDLDINTLLGRDLPKRCFDGGTYSATDPSTSKARGADLALAAARSSAASAVHFSNSFDQLGLGNSERIQGNLERVHRLITSSVIYDIAQVEFSSRYRTVL